MTTKEEIEILANAIFLRWVEYYKDGARCYYCKEHWDEKTEE